MDERVKLKSYREALADFHRTYWTDALKLAGGNISKAAELAGVNRTAAYAALMRCGLHKSYVRNRGNSAWQELRR